MDELPVAVVDNMEKVEVLVPSPQPPRIIPEAVQNPVGIKGNVSGSGEACETTTHGWAEARREYGSGMVLSKVVKQHLSNQVHAGPILLEQIADNGNARQVQ